MNETIDKKIEYDHRFFCDTYQNFQLMISDIRKQIRINQEIEGLKKKIQKLYQELSELEPGHDGIQDGRQESKMPAEVILSREQMVRELGQSQK